MGRLTFDSCILIDQLNRHPAAAEAVFEADERWLSVVARAEVLAGAHTPEAFRIAVRLLEIFKVVDVDQVIADAAAALRRAHRIKLPDALILATAIHLDTPLITRDEHFPPSLVPIVIPYRLG